MMLAVGLGFHPLLLLMALTLSSSSILMMAVDAQQQFQLTAVRLLNTRTGDVQSFGVDQVKASSQNNGTAGQGAGGQCSVLPAKTLPTGAVARIPLSNVDGCHIIYYWFFVIS